MKVPYFQIISTLDDDDCEVRSSSDEKIEEVDVFCSTGPCPSRQCADEEHNRLFKLAIDEYFADDCKFTLLDQAKLDYYSDMISNPEKYAGRKSSKEIRIKRIR